LAGSGGVGRSECRWRCWTRIPVEQGANGNVAEPSSPKATKTQDVVAMFEEDASHSSHETIGPRVDGVEGEGP
jgi:hypothetical protein